MEKTNNLSVENIITLWAAIRNDLLDSLAGNVGNALYIKKMSDENKLTKTIVDRFFESHEKNFEKSRNTVEKITTLLNQLKNNPGIGSGEPIIPDNG